MNKIEQLLNWERHASRTLYAYEDTAGDKLRFDNVFVPHPPWSIEHSHYGYDIFVHGLTTKNQEVMRLGVSVLEYGIKRQLPDGSFDCRDAHHSAAFFLEELGRFILIAKHHHLKDVDLDRFEQSLRKGIEWFHQRLNWNDNWWRDSFHHRFFLNSSVLFIACEALGKKAISGSALEQAYGWLAEGIRRQENSGAITEYGGTDTGYQSLSITFASGILMLCEINQHTRKQLADCVEKACRWLELKVDGDGDIDDSENTRMAPTAGETCTATGKVKTIKFYETAFALYGAGLALSKQKYIDTSERVMRYYLNDETPAPIVTGSPK